MRKHLIVPKETWSNIFPSTARIYFNAVRQVVAILLGRDYAEPKKEPIFTDQLFPNNH